LVAGGGRVGTPSSTTFTTSATPSPSSAPRTWSGDAVQGLPELTAGLPDDALICLLDAYVHAFLSPRSLRASHV
jgi:hypothetical protein